MGGRAGGGARGGSGRAAGGIGGFQSAESVWDKAFADGKFRVGISKDNAYSSGDVYRLVTTNAKLDGGGKLTVQRFTGSKDSVLKIANALKAGKTYNQAYFEATGKYVNG